MTVPTLSLSAKPRTPSAKDAAAQGRRLAAQTAETLPPAPERSVEALARASVSRLRQMGVDAEVLRSRSGCLVVRSAVRPPGDPAWACALVSGWLESLPSAAHGSAGTLVESTCASRGGRSCIHTLMWQEPALPSDPPGTPTPGSSTQAAIPSSTAAVLSDASPPWAQLLPDPPPVPIPNAPPPVPIPDAPPPVPIPDAPPPVVHASDPAPVMPSPALQPSVPEPTVPFTTVRAAPVALAPMARHDRAPRRATGRWPWFRRRAWLLAIGLLAGGLGGELASTHSPTGYSAAAVVVVHGGSSTAAASSASGAAALAVTYAALVPSDQALLARVAAQLGLPPADVATHLSVEAESGTSLIDVKFADASAAVAVAGANDVVRGLTSARPPGRAIAPGSLTTVSAASTAAKSGTLHKYGLPLGIVLGLMVGAGAALVAERMDRRVDDIESLAAAAGCSSTMTPGGISYGELARALEREGDEPVTVLALRPRDAPAATDIRRSLADLAAKSGAQTTHDGAAAARAPAAAGDVRNGTNGTNRSPGANEGRGPTLLVVGRGERAVAVAEAAGRLRLVGQDPAFAVLLCGGGTGSGLRPGSGRAPARSTS